MAESGKSTLCSGIEVEIFDGDKRKDIQDAFEWSKKGFIKPVNKNWKLSTLYLKWDEKLYNFEYRPTDIFIVGSQKSGTTWTQEIIWTMLNNANLDHPMQQENAFIRVPLFEGDSLWTNKEIMNWSAENLSKTYDIPRMNSTIDMFAKMKNPRVFKSHLFSSVINQEMLDISKIVYVIRNPLDSFYSRYKFHLSFPTFSGFVGDIRSFFDRYLKSEVWCGNAPEHILSWWPYRNHKNLHMIFYEDIKSDPEGEIRKLATFLEKSLSKGELYNIIHHTSFNVMKEFHDEGQKKISVKAEGSFFRKGEVGDSKNMPGDIYEKLAAYCDHQLKELDLPYDFSSSCLPASKNE